MTRAPDTLSSLDLTEQPGQRITYFRRVAHRLVDGPVELQPGEKMFAIGAAHHDFYVYLVESEGLPAPDLAERRSGPLAAALGLVDGGGQ